MFWVTNFTVLLACPLLDSMIPINQTILLMRIAFVVLFALFPIGVLVWFADQKGSAKDPIFEICFVLGSFFLAYIAICGLADR